MPKFSCQRYFPAELDFTPEQCAQFLHLEQTLVREALDEYAEYRTVPLDERASVPMFTSVLDPLEWRAVHRRDALTVYKDRKAKRKSQEHEQLGLSSSGSSHCSSNSYTSAGSNGSNGSSTSSTSSARRVYTQQLRRPDGDFTTIEAKWAIPTLLVHGHIRGRLNDTMYGAFADSDNGFRLRTAHLDDGLDDSKILYTFERASLEDPFRFCGLVWYVYGQKLAPLVRRRDNVLLVAMGLTTSKEGDRIGYTVMHSVDLPQLRPLTQYKIERAYGSLVFVKRQLDDDRVEMFQKGFFTPMGDVPEFAIVHSVMRGMLRAGSATIEASLSKKLYWMMQDAARLRRQSSKSCGDDIFAPLSGECGGGCRARLSFNSSRGTCMICRKLVCSNCKVSRKLTLEATADGLVQKTLCFCALCVTIARNTSALTIAARELLEKDAMASSFRSVRSHGSSSICGGGCEREPVAEFSSSLRGAARKAHVLWEPET